MSQKSNITIDAIAAATAQLKAEGKKDTIAAIQAIVGGSMTTITRLVRELRGEAETAKAAEVSDSEGVELPPNIARALATVTAASLAALADVRAEERRSARAEIDAIRAEADSKSKAEAEKLEAAQAEFEALAEQADKLEADLSAATEARKAAEIRASEAEARLAERDSQISDLVRQISDLAAQIGTVKTEVKAPRKKRAARSSQIATAG